MLVFIYPQGFVDLVIIITSVPIHAQNVAKDFISPTMDKTIAFLVQEKHPQILKVLFLLMIAKVWKDVLCLDNYKNIQLM